MNDREGRGGYGGRRRSPDVCLDVKMFLSRSWKVCKRLWLKLAGEFHKGYRTTIQVITQHMFDTVDVAAVSVQFHRFCHGVSGNRKAHALESP